MKNIGDNFRLEKSRNKELYELYHSLYFERGLSVDEIAEEITKMPAKRFYVDEGRAAIVISRMMKGQRLDSMLEMKREMYREIYQRAVRLKRTMPKGTPIKTIVSKVVREPAPLFYIKKGTIKRVIYRIIKGWYRKREKMQGHSH